MKENNIKTIRKLRRVRRVRNKILGSRGALPRLSVFRSNKYIYAQLIDDKSGKTLAAVNERNLTGTEMKRDERAKLVGQKLAELAKSAKVKKVVFDKGSYRYHGRVRALAEGAREGGLVF